MRRRLSAIITIILLATSFMPAYATNINIDNQNVQFTEASGAPFIDQTNRTQVPFRKAMEQYGCTVSWDSVTQTVVVVSGTSGAEPGKTMTIHFIDVGQGDSIFIDFDDYEALIDAGNNGDGDLVVNYIKPYVSGNLNLVIATHVHEDHIGGLDDVIDAFQVDKIIESGDHSSSDTFNDYLTAVSNEEKCNYMADENMTIDMGDGASLKIIDTMDGNSNPNNDSVIALLDYNDFEALFPGDAEAEAEATFLSKLYDVDVLKAGITDPRQLLPKTC